MNGSEGIRCPRCGSLDHQMTDSHSVAYFRRRHYVCRRCGRRFATREVSEELKIPTNGPGKSLTLCHVRSAP
jgi:DNA-directed RNA polymerase subunit RPC12/RpoP